MIEFQADLFLHLLEDAPSKPVFLEPPEYSEYLKKQVFDALKEKGGVKLKGLDWSAFGLSHATPEDYLKKYDRITRGWAETLNVRLQTTPAVADGQRDFF